MGMIRILDVLLFAAGAMAAHAFLLARRIGRMPSDVQLSPVLFERADDPLRVLRRAETVLARRCSSLLLVLERVSESHTFSAVLRTAEALGVQSVWIVAPASLGKKSPLKADAEAHATYAKHAERFLTIRSFATAAECVAAVREDRRTIWATELSSATSVLAANAPWIRSSCMPARLALVMGTDDIGSLSSEMRAAADRLVYVPVHGFTGPLPLSVAAALCMHATLNLLGLANADVGRTGGLADFEKKVLRRKWYALPHVDRIALLECSSSWANARSPARFQVPAIGSKLGASL
jgi:tRNA G18 (ribose-2'-O)-methylase SpoU